MRKQLLNQECALFGRNSRWTDSACRFGLVERHDHTQAGGLNVLGKRRIHVTCAELGQRIVQLLRPLEAALQVKVLQQGAGQIAIPRAALQTLLAQA